MDTIKTLLIGFVGVLTIPIWGPIMGSYYLFYALGTDIRDAFETLKRGER